MEIALGTNLHTMSLGKSRNDFNQDSLLFFSSYNSLVPSEIFICPMCSSPEWYAEVLHFLCLTHTQLFQLQFHGVMYGRLLEGSLE